VAQKPSILRCSKCGKAVATETPKCPACGNRVVKICGACAFANSAAKNYCDSCGEPLKLASQLPPEPVKPPPQAAPPPREAPPPPPKAEPPKEAPPPPSTPKPPALILPREALLPPPKGAKLFSDKKILPKPEAVEKKELPSVPAKAESPPPSPEKPAPEKPKPSAEAKTDPAPPASTGKPDLEKKPDPPPKTAAPEPPPPSASGERTAPPRTAAPEPPLTLKAELRKDEAPPKPPPPAADKAAEEPPKERPRHPDLELPKTGIIRMSDRPKEEVDSMLRKLGIGPLPEPPKKEPPKAEIRRREPQPPPKPPAPAADRAAEEPHKKEYRHGPPAKPVASTMLGLMLFLITAGLYAAYWWHFKHNPKTKLIRTATRYLSALQAGDAEAAYGLLSQAARNDVTLDDLKRFMPPTGWSFEPSSVSIESQEENWALINCETRSSGSSEKDRLEFILEGGRWLRAYDWPLLARAEQAIDDGDYAAADQAARKAAVVDPHGALARYYLCESAYYRQSPQEALTECRLTADLAAKSRAVLDDANQFHLHSILADLYKNQLEKPDFVEAVREYGLLLTLPRLEAAQRCDILLARADARALSGDTATATKDYQDAGGVCASEDDLGYARAATRIFSGQAGSEAIEFVKRHRMPDDSTTVIEWREEARKELLDKFKSQGAKLKPAPDAWAFEHLGGSNYKVTARTADVEILSAQVDLWNQKAKVDFHVQ